MNNKKKQKQEVKCFDLFESDSNLWNIIGPNKSLIMLKKLVDSQQWYQNQKPPSIMISGGQGKRFLAAAYIHSLGMEIKEIPAGFLDCYSNGKSFFLNADHNDNIAYLVTNLETLKPSAEYSLWQLLKVGSAKYYAPQEGFVLCQGPFIFTCNDLSRVNPYIRRELQYIIPLESYSQEELKLLVFQRLKYSNISYENELILERIVQAGENNLKKIINIVRNAITMMFAEGRDCLTLKDVDLALRLIKI